MNKFLIKISGFILLILSLLVSVNYWGDGARIFDSEFERNIADIILNNQNATNITNYDDRILQKEIISRINKRPDIAVLGSSRTILINSTFYESEKFINNSVTGASLQDLIAIYQLYKNKQLLPKKIILGVDPWLFNTNNKKDRWRTLESAYESFSDKAIARNENLISNELKQLFSLSYFQASLKNIPSVIKGKSNPIPSNEIYNQTITKQVDGSLSYGNEFRNASSSEVKKKVEEFVSGKIYSLENYNSISDELMTEFNQFCNTIIADQVALEFILAPYHPTVYEKLQSEYPMVEKSEKLALEFAKNNKIKSYGTFDPIRLQLNSNDFYDAMHCKQSTILKILRVEQMSDEYTSIANW